MSARRRAAFALILVAPVTALGTWAVLVGFPGPVGRALYLATKLWVILAPALWLVVVERGRIRVPRYRREGMGLALGSGLAMAAAVVGAYLVVRGPELKAMRPVLIDAGLHSVPIYLAAALYWTTLNSLLEEYVWRYFVTTHAVRLVGRVAGVLLAAGLFTVHHYVALSAYASPAHTWLGCGGVFVAGCIWSWLFARTGNFWACYVSHALADLAVFAVGYDILFVL